MALRRREPSGRWRYDEEQGRKPQWQGGGQGARRWAARARRRATTRSKEQGDLSGKEEGLGGRHEVVERGGAQPCGWLICFFLVFVAVGGRERQCVHDFSFSLN